MTDGFMRQGKIAIKWSATGIGSVSLDGVVFARVEWSERRQKFCIEDSEGQCLTHVGSIKGMAISRDEAVALAFAMIRDGRMPDPKTARAEHREREKLREERLRAAQEKRRQQPAEIQRREAKAEQLRRWSDAATKAWRLEEEEDAATPLYEALANAFNSPTPNFGRATLLPRSGRGWRFTSAASSRGLRKILLPKSAPVPAVFVQCADGAAAGGSSPQGGRYGRGDRQDRAKLSRAREILAILAPP